VERILSNKSHITRNKLLHYFKTLLGITAVLVLFSFAMNLVGIWQFNRTANDISTMNGFFEEVMDTGQLMEHYVQLYEESDYENLEQNITDLNSQAEYFSNTIQVGNSKRIFRDISHMLSAVKNNMKSTKTLISEKSTFETEVVWVKAYESQYEKAEEGIGYIQSEKSVLNVQLLGQMSVIRERLRLNLIISAAVTALVLIFSGFYAYWNAKSLAEEITEPIEKLTQEAERIQTGNLMEMKVHTVYPTDNNELSQLAEAFYLMLLRIQNQFTELQKMDRMKEELQQSELENLKVNNLLKNMELKALQHQINPHFLFNTLNMISYTAYLEDAEKTQTLISTVAAFLRYSLDYSDRTALLSQELEALENYVSLQEQRFGDRIKFHFDLDCRIDRMKIPSLILQPLVENAVVHGIGSYTENGYIVIQTVWNQKQKTAVLRVSDNGVGIENDKLLELRNKMKEIQEKAFEEEATRHIGLANVYLRLLLFTGGKADLQIDSTVGKNTTITLTIPCSDENLAESEAVNDNNIDR